MAVLHRFIALFLAAVLVSVCSGKRRYDGYQVLRATSTSAEQRELIKVLEQDSEFDVWSQGLDHVDVMVSPGKLAQLKNLLAQHKATYVVLHANVQKNLDEEDARLSRNRAVPSPFLNYQDFNTYTDIMAELDAVVLRCPVTQSIKCETFVIGQSYEGRAIKGLRIYRTNITQKAIWIDANIHAREWLAGATHLMIISHLVDDYAIDAVVQGLVNKYQWYLVPLSNPDGYEWSWASDRYWRKNRSPNNGSLCIGTDLNRNFDHQWGNAGTGISPCVENYGGSGPGSEVEVQAAQTFLNSIGSNLVTSIHLHTYSQLWLIPWGSVDALGNCNIATDNAELMVAANAAADATQNTHGTIWERGNWCQVLYPASGNAQDYSKGVSGVKYTFTPELRGTDFVIPPDQILPSFQEVWNGVVAAITTIDP